MARAATTLDPFNAIAEPKRRRVLDVLAGGELQVNGIVKTLGWPQPVVSKHLGVLRQVGLVDVRREGRRQMYKLNAENLRPIHDWVKTYERFWSHQLQRIKVVAEAKAKIPNSETSNNRSDSNG
ncbi:MAG TPA: metalloregulator ArsR/SmtB family transcription factor [Tepidisphaeraceae bacterium]|jgi:DNA-binding transcriptional ArsR family regulator